MDSVILLPYTPNGYIEIDASNRNWATCTLVEGEERTQLGSESFEWIAKRLLNALTTWGAGNHERYFGLEVEYALVLAPGYPFTLYTAKLDSGRLLMWQDRDCKLKYLMYLSPEQVNEWCRTLHIAENSKVETTVVDDKQVVEAARAPSYRLDQLLEKMTSENTHGEVSPGGAAGEEE